MDEGLLTSNIFIDLRKAFDTVDHTTLLRKTKLLWFPRQISKLVLSHTSKTDASSAILMVSCLMRNI